MIRNIYMVLGIGDNTAAGKSGNLMPHRVDLAARHNEHPCQTSCISASIIQSASTSLA